MAAPGDDAEDAREILVRGFRLAPWEAPGGERALHLRVGADHRLARVALAEQVVQRLAEHFRERLPDRHALDLLASAPQGEEGHRGAEPDHERADHEDG